MELDFNQQVGAQLPVKALVDLFLSPAYQITATKENLREKVMHLEVKREKCRERRVESSWSELSGTIIHIICPATHDRQFHDLDAPDHNKYN